jgi:molecular chaperone DnaK
MQFKEGQTVGIDLGTTFSTLAYLNENGDPVPVPNEDEQVETPSLIVLSESGHVIVGPNRSRAAMEDPQNVVECIKREMGSATYKRTFDGKEITPEFLSALILKKLRQDAEKRIGPIANAVITVPYYFNDARRKATQDAGAIAGLHVVDIINEPTAATLTYAWHRGELGALEKADEKPRLAMVYDLGGGTFDVTLVRYTPTHFQVLGTGGDVKLGGVDWDDRLVDYVCREWMGRYGSGLRESPLAIQMLRHVCDEAKLRLSQSNQTTINFRHGGKAMSVTVTRDQFEEMTADLLQRTLDTTDLVLEEARLDPKKIDALVLVGGSTLMPKVVSSLKQLTGLDPYQKLNRYTSVAQGAAIHAAILEARFRGEKSKLADKVRKYLANIRQEDVNSHGLGVVVHNPKTESDVNHIMIPKNTTLPFTVSQVFQTREDNQQRVNVQVVEGDAPDPGACVLIGNCRVTDLPAGLPKGSPIEVSYSYDKAGRIRVTARDMQGGREAKIEIERRGGLTETQVDAYTRLAAEYKVD